MPVRDAGIVTCPRFPFANKPGRYQGQVAAKLANDLSPQAREGMVEKFDNRFRWRPIDTAPSDQDVKLVVTDGRGDPYLLPHPCRRTMAGWVSSSKGTPLVVTPLRWKPYVR